MPPEADRKNIRAFSMPFAEVQLNRSSDTHPAPSRHSNSRLAIPARQWRRPRIHDKLSGARGNGFNRSC